MLDAKIASALNTIIQNSQFKKKASLEEQKAQKEDWFLRGKQIAHMIYDYFRVTAAHDTVLDYANLLSITLRTNNIQDFDTRWDEVLLSMSKSSSDDVLESLYKLRICESDETQNRIRTVRYEYSSEDIGYQLIRRLKTMVKRSIDQKLRLRNFEARHGRIATGAVVSRVAKGMSGGIEGGNGSLLTSGKKKNSVRKETNAVSGMTSNDRANEIRPQCRHTF